MIFCHKCLWWFLVCWNLVDNFWRAPWINGKFLELLIFLNLSNEKGWINKSSSLRTQDKATNVIPQHFPELPRSSQLWIMFYVGMYKLYKPRLALMKTVFFLLTVHFSSIWCNRSRSCVVRNSREATGFSIVNRRRFILIVSRSFRHLQSFFD